MAMIPSAQILNMLPGKKISRHVSVGVGKFPDTTAQFAHIHIDAVGLLPPSEGQHYLLTVTDRFTHWPEAILTDNISMRHWPLNLCHRLLPILVVCFIRPWTEGSTAVMCPESQWTSTLPLLLLGLRNMYKLYIEGSPAELVYGEVLRLSGEFMDPHARSLDDVNAPVFVVHLRERLAEI
ncbi:uncharacterized protein LOC124805448 [Schistocerca piceifrons]|uniref:uncharacterized protein LOC124805448 n=1 Tax=Schistocerca piceifrons TaxID=274613 RepID=UPI001F5E6909|nr:uncharacterized protein LOC124805448 [Schistocerca piceifrons]